MVEKRAGLKTHSSSARMAQCWAMAHTPAQSSNRWMWMFMLLTRTQEWPDESEDENFIFFLFNFFFSHIYKNFTSSSLSNNSSSPLDLIASSLILHDFNHLFVRERVDQHRAARFDSRCWCWRSPPKNVTQSIAPEVRKNKKRITKLKRRKI